MARSSCFGQPLQKMRSRVSFRAETAVERRIYRALALLAAMRAQGPGNLLSAAGFNRFSYINYASYIPVPDNATFCGLPAALSLTPKAALRAPVALGLNLILIVQLAPAANELPQV